MTLRENAQAIRRLGKEPAIQELIALVRERGRLYEKKNKWIAGSLKHLAQEIKDITK